jgi:hypothetical protein
MGMLVSGINMQISEHITAKSILRQHALNGFSTIASGFLDFSLEKGTLRCPPGCPV